MARTKLGICKNCQKRVEEADEVCPHCGEPKPFRNMDEELLALKLRGQMVDAMKRVMRVTGWGLKQSKDYIDAL